MARAVEGGPRAGAASGGAPGGEDIPFGLRRRLGTARVGRDPGTPVRQDSDLVRAAQLEQIRRSIAAVAYEFVTQVVDLSSTLLAGVESSQPRARPDGKGQPAATCDPGTLSRRP